MDKKDKLLQFSESIISHDVPLYTMKTILYLISKEQKEIDINKLCSLMYINKRKLVNELSKIKPIESILEVDKSDEGFFQLIVLDEFKIELFEEKKKKGKKEDAKVKTKNQREADILEVFQYWCEIMGKTSRTRLDTKRRRVINTALDFLTVEECKLAIFGCSQSPWHMGHNPQNKLYNSLELIFRDEDKIEGFIADAKGLSLEERVENEKSSKPVKIEERMEDNDWISQRINHFGQKSESNEGLIESKKETLQIEYQENKLNDYDVKGIVKASLLAMGMIDENKENDIAEFEIIQNNIEDADFEIIEEKESSTVEAKNDDEIPLYLKLAKEQKNKLK